MSGALGAQGHADGDLTIALGHREGHDRVDAGDGEQQRASGEGGDELGIEVAWGFDFGDCVVEGAHVLQGQQRIDLGDGRAQSLDHVIRVERASAW